MNTAAISRPARTRVVAGAVALAVTAIALVGCGGGGSGSGSGSGGSAPPATPTATLSSNAASIAANGSVVLTWASTNATACTASGGWAGAKSTSGTETISGIAATTSFSLSCSGAGGAASASATVTVVPPPTVTLSASPLQVQSGASSTLTWSSTDATACTASGAWSGSRGTSGTESSPALTAPATFALDCTGVGGSARATTAVTIAAPPPQSLSYPSPSVLSLGQATALTPTVTGLVTSYEINPSLPGGLTLSPITGVIFGTPNQASAETSYVVTARNPAGATSFTLRLRVAIPRATADRPDEVSGYQIHVMYVIPGNGTDQALDTSGTLAGSVASWQSWFEAQTGGRRLRLDTFAGGNLDVTFLELPRSDAVLQSAGVFLRDRIEYLLLEAGFDDPNKLYLVYYGGTSTVSCGSGPYPPSLPGTVTGVYLLSAPPGGAPCATQGFARADEPPRYLEFLAAHEVLHGLGMAPTCAPNYVGSAHVGDSPDDLMYAGTQPWTPRTLDVNRDDYFGAGRPGCADLANSAFLSPLPASAEPPAGWPYDNLATLDCALEPTLTPSTPGAISYLTIVSGYARNGSSIPVDVSELRTDGFGRFGRWYLETLARPGDGMLIATRANSYYVASVNGACVALLRPGDRPGRFVVR